MVHKRLFCTSVVNLQNIITIAALCCTVNRPFSHKIISVREYSRSNYHYAAIQYSRLHKSCNKQAERWKTTIDLLCLNREEGHAEAER